MTTDLFMIILYCLAGIFVTLLIVLGIVALRMKTKEIQGEIEEKKKNGQPEVKQKEKVKQYTVGSVFDFMEFDKVEDNMIVQRNGSKYIMVLDCQGINYDLMSEPEKVSVEEGFIQFLNALAGPIQMYIQTRTINLESSIQNYKVRVNEIENAYNKQKMRYEQLVNSSSASDEEIKKQYYELVKQRNLCEYGKDIIYNTEQMSLNRNILTKKYYVVLAYYTSELGGSNFDKEEIKEMAFSELYTRAQTVIRALSISGVIGKIMSSTDLVDLLYMAYNRDDAEIYGIDKAMRARYDELYSTAPDYMDKKIKMLDEEIEKRAYKKANEKVIEAQTEKQKEYQQKEESLDDIIDKLAALIIDDNSNSIGRETADIAKEKITEEKQRREKDKDVQEKAKRSRRVSSSTK